MDPKIQKVKVNRSTIGFDDCMALQQKFSIFLTSGFMGSCKMVQKLFDFQSKWDYSDELWPNQLLRAVTQILASKAYEKLDTKVARC